MMLKINIKADLSQVLMENGVRKLSKKQITISYHSVVIVQLHTLTNKHTLLDTHNYKLLYNNRLKLCSDNSYYVELTYHPRNTYF